MAIGGYTTAILTAQPRLERHRDAAGRARVGFVAGVIVGLPALRFQGAYLALLTFARRARRAAAREELLALHRRHRGAGAADAHRTLAVRRRPGRAARSRLRARRG